jgi:hypothetical protein
MKDVATRKITNGQTKRFVFCGIDPATIKFSLQVKWSFSSLLSPQGADTRTASQSLHIQM